MKRTGDKIISVVLFIFCALYFYLSLSFSVQSRAYPQATIVLLFFLLILLFLSTFSKKKKLSTIKVNENNKDKVILSRVVGVIFITLLFIFLIGKIGFYITTEFFLVGTMYFLGIRSYKILLLVPSGFTLLLFIGFKLLLEVSTPTGILF